MFLFSWVLLGCFQRVGGNNWGWFGSDAWHVSRHVLGLIFAPQGRIHRRGKKSHWSHESCQTIGAWRHQQVVCQDRYYRFVSLVALFVALPPPTLSVTFKLFFLLTFFFSECFLSLSSCFPFVEWREGGSCVAQPWLVSNHGWFFYRQRQGPCQSLSQSSCEPCISQLIPFMSWHVVVLAVFCSVFPQKHLFDRSGHTHRLTRTVRGYRIRGNVEMVLQDRDYR